MEITEKKKRRYITGFDGIRSLAVIGVILYHLLPTSMKGGYLGVPIFFVLSGYLITDLLLQEWQENKRIAIWKFYVRRMKRLYPGLVAMFLFATTYITLFQRNLLTSLRQIVITSLLYLNNWWQIGNGLSYFDRFANESPFTHIWSLAVEGQHYLIWPILFIILIRLLKKRPNIFYSLMGLAALSALLMGILFDPDKDPTRIYYGTDTRWFSILIGCALAFIWPSTRLKQVITPSAKRILDITGIASLLLVIAGLFLLDDHLNGIYNGGMFVYSLLCALLVAVTAHPGASLNKWLTNPVFSWIGKRSYGIYLYQFPVMIFYEAKIRNLNEFVWLHTLIEILLILVMSELSYRFIEEPFRRFDYSNLKERFKNAIQHPVFNRKTALWIPVACALVISLVGLASAPKDGMTAEQEQLQKQIAQNKKLAEKTKQQTAPASTAESASASDSSAETSSSEANPEAAGNPYGLNEAQAAAAQTMQMSAFGDSIMLDVTPDFQQIFPTIVVDGDIGRQLYKSAGLLADMATNGQLKENVIISLGTNGPFTEAQFDEVMSAIGDRKVYWVNLHLPTRRWEAEVNTMLTQMDQKYDNLTLIDWNSYSQGHEEWFYEDRVHPNPEGSVAYCSLVAQTILADEKKD